MIEVGSDPFTSPATPELLRGVGSTLRFPPYREEASFSETPEVVVTLDSTGAEVFNGKATKVEATDDEPEYYVVALDGSDVAQLDRLTATWSDTENTYTSYAEIVGGRMCSLTQITDEINGEEITDAKLALARSTAEQILEDECGVAWRPRYGRESLDGSGQQLLLMPTPKLISLRTVTVDDEEVDAADLKVYMAAGTIWREATWAEGAQNVELIYEHGFLTPPPTASRVCALLARHFAVKRLSNLDDRATTYSTDEATYNLITPGVRGMATAIPEVNAFINANQFLQVG